MALGSLHCGELHPQGISYLGKQMIMRHLGSFLKNKPRLGEVAGPQEV